MLVSIHLVGSRAPALAFLSLVLPHGARSWWVGALNAESIFEKIAAAARHNYTASIGIGINHPPNSVNSAARYYNSWGQQALQQQAPGRDSLGPMTDGTGVNYPFHEELWPQLEKYFAALSQMLFVKYKIPRSAVKVIRIGMDKTGEFNYPYSEVHGGGDTNNTWWAFDSGGTPYRDYPAVLVSALADDSLRYNTRRCSMILSRTVSLAAWARRAAGGQGSQTPPVATNLRCSLTITTLSSLRFRILWLRSAQHTFPTRIQQCSTLVAAPMWSRPM